jgi:hypothetical protein
MKFQISFFYPDWNYFCLKMLVRIRHFFPKKDFKGPLSILAIFMPFLHKNACNS